MLLSLILLTFCSCTPGMYEMLHRSIDDPVIVSPNVDSYAESSTIFISWDYDEGADEYILERADDHPLTLSFNVIYQGKETKYADCGLENSSRYIYRLSKRRGVEIFGPSTEVLGVSSLIIRDIYRNNTLEQAIKIDSIDYIANLYYNRAYNGLEIMEEDWYYVEVPPLRQAWIVVDDLQAYASDTLSYFEYYIYTRESSPVFHLQDFRIINNELETKKLYFKIYPAKHRFAGMGTPPGGGIVHYKISLVSITPIQTGG